MVMRRIMSAHRREKSTVIKLECSHERSLGGHIFNGIVHTPQELEARSYDCYEGPCLRISMQKKK